MNAVLQNMEDFSNAYIDDVIVFSKSWDEHLQDIKKVLISLRRTGLTAKPLKCEWGATTLTYLGHIVGEGMVSIPEAKVEALKNFIRPKTKKNLRSFLGTIGYYRRFVPGFSQKAYPLTEATKQKAPNSIIWNDTMCEAFHELCTILSHATNLHIPTPQDQFVLHTDASGKGIGAVLGIIRDGEEIPVGYYSKKLIASEQKYAVTEMECLAVVKAISHFEVYLTGRQFTVVTDHSALQYLQSSWYLNGRLTRWALQLQHHDFSIKHRKWKTHQNADGLSRQAWKEEDN